jgi:hypothetical protein
VSRLNVFPEEERVERYLADRPGEVGTCFGQLFRPPKNLNPDKI